MKTLYRAYGLTFSSSVSIPALSAIGSPDDVPEAHFEMGKPPQWAVRALQLRAKRIPTSKDGMNGNQPAFALTEYGGGSFFQLAYADGTRFLVDEHATHIWGEPGPGLSDEDAFVYLLGPILAFVLRRKGYLTLHASAFEMKGSAHALCGEAGSGKSTLAAALALRGHSLLCEDVCALEEQSGTTTVVPGYPRVCLWPESVKILFSSVDALPRIVHGWNKRYFELDGVRGQFAQGNLPLAGIYLLAPRSDAPAAPFVERLTQTEATLQLVQNTYMNYLLSKEQRAAEFGCVARLASTVPCFRLTASRDPARVPELVSLIERHSESVPAHV